MRKTTRFSLAHSEGSSCSHSSVTSRLSVEGADAHAIAHHDAKLQECFNSGNIEFLVNLLGPIDAACGFLRKKKIKFYEEFLTGSARAPKVTRKQIHEASKTNWPDEVQQIMAVHDSVAVRMKLRPFFDNSNTSKNFIKEMIELCGGDHNRSDDCGVVVVWSECCRHQCDEGAFYIAQQYTCSHTQLEIMTSQCLTSSKIFLAPEEKKKIIKYTKHFFEKYQNPLMDGWMAGRREARDDAGCCTVL